MSKANKIEHQQHIEECVEYILQNKSGWTQFTTWAREKYDINNKMANELWKSCWVTINELFDDNIKSSVNESLVKLEALEQLALQENDRRILLEIIKYRNKIRGGEIERQEINIKSNITLNWGDETKEETK